MCKYLSVCVSELVYEFVCVFKSLSGCVHEIVCVCVCENVKIVIVIKAYVSERKWGERRNGRESG